MEETIDKSGFYKQANGEWFYAKFEVVAPNYTLSRKRYEEIGIAENKEGWVFHNEEPSEYTELVENQNTELEIFELKGE